MNEYFNFRCNNEYFKYSEFHIIWTLNAEKLKATINQINNYRQMFHMHMLCPLNINTIISYRSENDWVFDPSLVTHITCTMCDMLVTDVGDTRCWLTMATLWMKCIADEFEMSSTSSRQYHYVTNITEAVTTFDVTIWPCI